MHRVVVVGSGFGGLFAAQALRRSPVEVTVVASTTHHLFQPLLYQVATGILAPGEIAPTTRNILRGQRNARVRLGTVTDVDLVARTVTAVAPELSYTVPYDSLIVAAGATQSYFGNDGFAAHAPGMKSVDDALELRGRIFGAFEMAELADDAAARERWLTFVVVGAGATGVEMAGQIAELAHRTLPGEFARIDPRRARIVLVDAGDEVLGGFGGRLSAVARARLGRLGVEVRLGTTVVDVDESGIVVEDRSGVRSRVRCMTKMWAAGVAGAALGARLAERAGVELDRAGRVRVAPDCSVPGFPEVFVVGDLMALDDLPGVAQVAIQSGRHAAYRITRRLHGDERVKPFRYVDRGSMATVSRFSAVAAVGPVRVWGFAGWLLWLAVHLLYLVGFKNRLTALLHWGVSFFGRARSERTVTVQQVVARSAIARVWEESGPGRGARSGPVQRLAMRRGRSRVRRSPRWTRSRWRTGRVGR